MNVTLATPAVFVVLVAAEKVPPDPVLVQVTTFPAVATEAPVSSLSCTDIVTSAPAIGEVEPEVTTYLFAETGTMRISIRSVNVAAKSI